MPSFQFKFNRLTDKGVEKSAPRVFVAANRKDALTKFAQAVPNGQMVQVWQLVIEGETKTVVTPKYL